MGRKNKKMSPDLAVLSPGVCWVFGFGFLVCGDGKAGEEKWGAGGGKKGKKKGRRGPAEKSQKKSEAKRRTAAPLPDTLLITTPPSGREPSVTPSGLGTVTCEDGRGRRAGVAQRMLIPSLGQFSSRTWIDSPTKQPSTSNPHPNPRRGKIQRDGDSDLDAGGAHGEGPPGGRRGPPGRARAGRDGGAEVGRGLRMVCV